MSGSGAGRRRWWQAVAVAVVGGGALAGGWVGLTRPAAAEPVNTPLAPPNGDGVWTRSAATDPPTGGVVPASAEVPSMTAPEPPGVTPAAAPALLPVPGSGTGLTPGPVQPPAIPPLPSLEPPPAKPPVGPSTVPPTLPDPAALPALPGGPAAPTGPAVPTPKPDVPKPDPVTPPVLPAVPSPNPAVEPPKFPAPAAPSDPAVLPTPAPVLPPGLPVPAPADLTPPPPLAKSPEPVQSPTPAKPESGLPGGNGGNNVKPDVPPDAPAPVLPVPAPVLPEPKPVAPVGPLANPVVPALPAVGSPGEPSGVPAERTLPAGPPAKEPALITPPAPIIPYTPASPTPGDSTVSAFSQSAAAAILGGALLAATNPAPAPAAPPFPTPAAAVPAGQGKSDEKAEHADLKKALDESNRKLGEIQKQLAQLSELLNGKKDSDGYPITGSGLLDQVKDLKNRLAAIEDDLRKMKTSSSLRPNTPSAVDPKANMGTVRVVNEYPVRISIVVNGTSYRIDPSKSQDIEVPAGEFTYQLLESGAAATRSTIKEKETVTLRIK